MSGGSEGREIVLANKAGGGLCHRGHVEGLPDVVHESAFKERALPGGVERVRVSLARAIADGVEGVGDMLGSDHKDVLWEAAVDRSNEIGHAAAHGPAKAPGRGCVGRLGCGSGRLIAPAGEHGHLAFGVHARVGAAGAEKKDGLANDLADRPLQDVLHGAQGDAPGATFEGFACVAAIADLACVAGLGRQARLAGDVDGEGLLLLPPAEVGSLVGDDEFVSGHWGAA